MASSGSTPFPPPPPAPIDRLISPFVRFMHTESSGGIVLILCTVVAIVWANSPWAAGYHALWERHIAVSAFGLVLDYSLHHWINDGLMAVFFFVVGLEIKREVLVGELASPRRAALPIAAALGGMLVPAGIYAAFNAGGPGAHGWGIPMATDIAFAIGVLALLGPRVPTSLKVFLTALAIADDLGAVLVIALFYTAEISFANLALGLALLAGLALLNALGVRRPIVYVLVGLVVWVAFLKSGVHATVAGVLLALTIPTRTRIDTGDFLRRGRRLLDAFDAAGEEKPDILTNSGQQAAMIGLEEIVEQAQSPLQRIVRALHGWVGFFIIPVFALANAGVHLGGDFAAALTTPITLGIALGLFVGKPVGITLTAWLAVKLNVAALPAGTSWRGVFAVSILGGIGFTMSLFVTNLAFVDPLFIDEAKIGIFTASLFAAVIGFLVLRRGRPVPEPSIPPA